MARNISMLANDYNTGEFLAGGGSSANIVAYQDTVVIPVPSRSQTAKTRTINTVQHPVKYGGFTTNEHDELARQERLQAYVRMLANK